MSARDRRHDYRIKDGLFPRDSPVRVPEFFNIAEACLMSHARAFPQAVALMDLSRDRADVDLCGDGAGGGAIGGGLAR